MTRGKDWISARLETYPSGDDAPVLVSGFSAGCDCPRRSEVEISLDRMPVRAAGGSEFGLAEAEVAAVKDECRERSLVSTFESTLNPGLASQRNR
jgi:hypothetical protein